MKDFEKDLIYYPNPDPIEEPRFTLNSVDELEKSEKYSVICNGTERVVYHTDSFDYVVVVDNEAYDLEISIHTPFKELAIRPTSFGIEPSVKGETVHIHLDEPRKFTVETDGGLHDALFVFCSRRIEKPENTTICFEKGKAYNVGVLTLKSNDTVYIEEGAVVSTPTCGPCLGGYMGILAAGERAVSTTNRNFVGRMGHVDSEVYLASPAVAAASAITGKISGPAEVM